MDVYHGVLVKKWILFFALITVLISVPHAKGGYALLEDDNDEEEDNYYVHTTDGQRDLFVARACELSPAI